MTEAAPIGSAAVDAAVALAPGPVLVTAPHSDDETLGAGGLIALLRQAGVPVHILYATDGRLSPSAANGGLLPEADSLVAARRAEALAGAADLGVPAGDLSFLDLPDGALAAHEARLAAAIDDALAAAGAKTILSPFRYDQHPDHLALGRAVRARIARGGPGTPKLLEYFVYWRYPLARVPDIRREVAVSHLAALDIGPVRALKRAALDRYTSQTTIWAPHQTRAILTPDHLDGHCAGDELFLTAPPETPVRTLFDRPSLWLRFNLRWGGPLVFFKKRLIG
ncbi:MAG: PIG-L family deacetylase [Paracoccaceae bacterium]|nr:PIG-L family deacetylase [Paracoccaceae bacterium]